VPQQSQNSQQSHVPQQSRPAKRARRQSEPEDLELRAFQFGTEEHLSATIPFEYRHEGKGKGEARALEQVQCPAGTQGEVSTFVQPVFANLPAGMHFVITEGNWPPYVLHPR
jgi:hypothetical protein